MWTRPHNRIKGIEVDGYKEESSVVLPRGIFPVTRGTSQDLARLKEEVSIVYPVDPSARIYAWGREAFFRSKSGGMFPKRQLVAYSVNSARRIVRGWYLTEHDQSPCGWYRKVDSCPIEAAWLDTIAVGKPSEPAWLYLRKPHRIEIDTYPNGDWMPYSSETYGTYEEASDVARRLATSLASLHGKEVFLRVTPHPDYC